MGRVLTSGDDKCQVDADLVSLKSLSMVMLEQLVSVKEKFRLLEILIDVIYSRFKHLSRLHRL